MFDFRRQPMTVNSIVTTLTPSTQTIVIVSVRPKDFSRFKTGYSRIHSSAPFFSVCNLAFMRRKLCFFFRIFMHHSKIRSLGFFGQTLIKR